MVKLKAALNQEEVIMLDYNKMYQSFNKTLNQLTSEISFPNGSFNFNGIEQDEITNVTRKISWRTVNLSSFDSLFWVRQELEAELEHRPEAEPEKKHAHTKTES